MAASDPYELLGIEPGASSEEVRAAFRRKVRQNHPDTASEDDERDDVQEIIEAYRLLIDPDSRAIHDSDVRRREGGVGGRRVRVTHHDTGRGTASAGSTGVCGVCRGTGSRSEEIECPECHGRGEFTALDRERARVIRCRRCGGRGRVRVAHKCSSCGGSGVRQS